MTAPSEYPSIAFTGKAGAGKTTAAEFLHEAGWWRQSIAKALKDYALELLGEGADKNRGFLQDFGQLVRKYDEDAWVKRMVKNMGNAEAVQGGVLRFAVDDMRFPNEYWKLRERGFVVVRITAERQRRIDRLRAIGKLQDEAQLDDISETALDDQEVDYTVSNDGTPEEFYEQLRDVVFREKARI